MIVAISAPRPCTIHDSGNMMFRSRAPAANVNGTTAMATIASRRSIDTMIATATTKLMMLRATSGANVRNSCTERMSEFAREMSWPDCTRS